LYSIREKKSVPASTTTEDENLNTEYQILNAEGESTTFDQNDSLASWGKPHLKLDGEA